jgi:hypothetical protein
VFCRAVDGRGRAWNLDDEDRKLLALWESIVFVALNQLGERLEVGDHTLELDVLEDFLYVDASVRRALGQLG